MRTLENIFSFLLCSQLYLEHLRKCLTHKLNECKQEDTHYLVLSIHPSIYQAVNICIVLNQNHILSSVQFSHTIVSDSLQPHGLQHARPLCPSPNPGVYSNSCPLSWWCHPTTLFSAVPFSSCLQSFPASGSFPPSQQVAKVLELQLQHQSFQQIFSVYFRTDWLDLFAAKGLSSLLQHHNSKASILGCSAFYMVQLTSIHDNWKNHNFD